MDGWGNLEGLIPILGGIYGLLMAYGILPRNPTNPEEAELWRRKFGKTMKAICPIIIVFGLLLFFGVLG